MSRRSALSQCAATVFTCVKTLSIGNISDVRRQFVRWKTFYGDANDKPANANDHLQETMRESNRNFFVTRTLELIEIAKITGDSSAAVDLQRDALALVDDVRLREVRL